MIAFSFSDIGNRCENLDLLSTINCQNDVFGMVIMDGYSCSEWNMKILSGRLDKCVFSGDLNKDIIEPCKSVPVKAAVCFLFKNNTHLHIYNAGDCRVYNKSGVLLTEDNSVAWKRLKENGIDNKKIPHLVCYCPDRNYLTSFVDFCSDEIIFNHLVFDLNDEIYLYNFSNELTQALMNILNNACDAINMKLKSNESKLIKITTTQLNNHIEISIIDNAGGIDKSVMNKIFEPYFTTKHKNQGTGLGLYMTHEIIEKSMNGHIEVSNSKFIYENKTYTGANFKIVSPSKS